MRNLKEGDVLAPRIYKEFIQEWFKKTGCLPVNIYVQGTKKAENIEYRVYDGKQYLDKKLRVVPVTNDFNKRVM